MGSDDTRADVEPDAHASVTTKRSAVSRGGSHEERSRHPMCDGGYARCCDGEYVRGLGIGGDTAAEARGLEVEQGRWSSGGVEDQQDAVERSALSGISFWSPSHRPVTSSASSVSRVDAPAGGRRGGIRALSLEGFWKLSERSLHPS